VSANARTVSINGRTDVTEVGVVLPNFGDTSVTYPHCDVGCLRWQRVRAAAKPARKKLFFRRKSHFIVLWKKIKVKN